MTSKQLSQYENSFNLNNIFFDYILYASINYYFCVLNLKLKHPLQVASVKNVYIIKPCFLRHVISILRDFGVE